MAGRIHDRQLLDALEVLEPKAFTGSVWRVVKLGRDPLLGAAAGGRWSPPEVIEALYTSLSREVALAEVFFHLSEGQPVFPSEAHHILHKLRVVTHKTLRFVDVQALGSLGVDMGSYSRRDYEKTHEIAAAAYFLEFDGLIVPSARLSGLNLVLFLDRLRDGHVLEVEGEEPVDWQDYRKQTSQ